MEIKVMEIRVYVEARCGGGQGHHGGCKLLVWRYAQCLRCPAAELPLRDCKTKQMGVERAKKNGDVSRRERKKKPCERQ